mgnify:CR=1 FL=1
MKKNKSKNTVSDIIETNPQPTMRKVSEGFEFGEEFIMENKTPIRPFAGVFFILCAFSLFLYLIKCYCAPSLSIYWILAPIWIPFSLLLLFGFGMYITVLITVLRDYYNSRKENDDASK